MELFVKVVFWLLGISVVLKCLCLGLLDYPRKTNRLLDLMDLLIALPFLLWAAVLLWA